MTSSCVVNDVTMTMMIASLYLIVVPAAEAVNGAGHIASETVSATANGLQEYCQWDIFEAKCPSSDEVIIMQAAQYGRMRYGRCIERDYGYVGCFREVLELADQRCSGRRGCKIEVPDKLFARDHPCPKDLTPYLAVNYTCLKVYSPSRHQCLPGTTVRVPISPSDTSPVSGFLASLSTGETGCGSTDTAWLIDAGPGQTVVLTLYDFGATRFHSTGTNSSRHQPHGSSVGQSASKGGSNCHTVYGTIRERVTGRVSTICSLGMSRIGEIYRAIGTGLELKLLTGNGDQARYFIIKYEVFGCADIELPPDGAVVSRKDNFTKVHCVISGQVSTLTCIGNRWSTLNPECPQMDVASGINGKLGSASLAQTGSLVIMTAIAVAIGIVIFIVGLCCFKRYHGRHRDAHHAAGTNGGEVDGPTLTGQRIPPHDFYGTSPRVPPSGGGGKLCDLYETTTTTTTGMFGAPPPYHNHPSGVSATTVGLPPSVNWVQRQQSYGGGKPAPRHRRRPGGCDDKDEQNGDSNENDYESMEDEIPTEDGQMVAPPHGTYHGTSGGVSRRNPTTTIESSFRPCTGGYMSAAVIPPHHNQQQQQQQQGTPLPITSYASSPMPLPTTTGGAMMTSRTPFFPTGYI